MRAYAKHAQYEKLSIAKLCQNKYAADFNLLEQNEK